MKGRLFLATALFLCLAGHVGARPVLTITPEQLVERADVVCNGLVLDVTKTGRKGEVVLHGNKGLAAEWWKARIKVLSVFKGSAPTEIEMTFPQLDWEKVKMVNNGPLQIGIAPQKRYRFYLNHAAKAYVGALDGEFDDGGAVEALSATEPDNEPPFLKVEAQRVAQAYVDKWRPRGQPAPDTVDGNYETFGNGSPKWAFQFWAGPPLNYPTYTYAAEVFVHPDRSVDPLSWIGTEFPRPNEAITQKDVGRTVRITQEIGRGEFLTVRGIVQKVEDSAITVHTAIGCSDAKPGEKVVVLRKELRSIQSGSVPD